MLADDKYANDKQLSHRLHRSQMVSFLITTCPLQVFGFSCSCFIFLLPLASLAQRINNFFCFFWLLNIPLERLEF